LVQPFPYDQCALIFSKNQSHLYHQTFIDRNWPHFY
jgi:hypothetical protein